MDSRTISRQCKSDKRRAFFTSFLIQGTSPFGGTALADIAFYHKPTKTLIVGDLIYNLPNTESMPSIFSRLFKTFSPGGAVHKKLIAGSVTNHESFVASAKAVDALDIQRIIPLHGVCFGIAFVRLLLIVFHRMSLRLTLTRSGSWPMPGLSDNTAYMKTRLVKMATNTTSGSL